MVENPKAGGVIRQVVITKDTKQWMELPRFFQVNADMSAMFHGAGIEVVTCDRDILPPVHVFVPAEERRGSVDERVEGGHEGAREDQEVSQEPEEQAPMEEEDEEVEGEHPCTVVGACREEETVEFLVHWSNFGGYEANTKCTYTTKEALGGTIDWLQVRDLMMGRKETPDYVQGMHGPASNWVELFFGMNGRTHSKVFRVLDVTAEGWATVQKQSENINIKSKVPCPSVNFETFEVDGKEWDGKTFMEWCQKGYDAASPEE